MSLSHIDLSNKATMAEVSNKAINERIAVTEALVTVNDVVAARFALRSFCSFGG